MSAKKSRPARTKPRYRMSAKARRAALYSIYKTSQRNQAIVDGLWRFVIDNDASPAGWGIVEAVLNRQTTETEYLAKQTKLLAEAAGLARDETVQS
jgi:hypothetical protein